PARLHLGAHPPHARRHPPPDLGYRPGFWAERARVAHGSQPDRFRGDHRAVVDIRPVGDGRSAMSDAPAKHIRTPLARVRGLGTARSGTRDFWRQRLTSVANIPLTIAVVVIVIMLLG